MKCYVRVVTAVKAAGAVQVTSSLKGCYPCALRKALYNEESSMDNGLQKADCPVRAYRYAHEDKERKFELCSLYRESDN